MFPSAFSPVSNRELTKGIRCEGSHGKLETPEEKPRLESPVVLEILLSIPSSSSLQSGLPRQGAKAEIATQDSRDPLDDPVDKVSRCERAASANKRPDKGHVRRQAERRERVVNLQSCITVLRAAI